MMNVRTSVRERGRAVPGVSPSTDGRESTLASQQMRTCARCGRHTMFVLDDAVGGWYACTACGRYA